MSFRLARAVLASEAVGASFGFGGTEVTSGHVAPGDRGGGPDGVERGAGSGREDGTGPGHDLQGSMRCFFSKKWARSWKPRSIQPSTGLSAAESVLES